jgi:hypothetical protein
VLAVLVASIVLRGTVTIGPLTPACRVGTPCGGPAPRVTLTFRSPARVVLATTAKDGTYAVELAPGTYTVSASRGMRIVPARIVVSSTTRRQSFAIDTGIR